MHIHTRITIFSHSSFSSVWTLIYTLLFDSFFLSFINSHSLTPFNITFHPLTSTSISIHSLYSHSHSHHYHYYHLSSHTSHHIISHHTSPHHIITSYITTPHDTSPHHIPTPHPQCETPPKAVGSRVGMGRGCATSVLLARRVDVVTHALKRCKDAIARREFHTFAECTMRVSRAARMGAVHRLTWSFVHRYKLCSFHFTFSSYSLPPSPPPPSHTISLSSSSHVTLSLHLIFSHLIHSFTLMLSFFLSFFLFLSLSFSFLIHLSLHTGQQSAACDLHGHLSAHSVPQ